MKPDFTGASALHSQADEIRRGVRALPYLDVMAEPEDWEHRWIQAIGMMPAAFHAGWVRDLWAKSRLAIDLHEPAGQGSFEFRAGLPRDRRAAMRVSGWFTRAGELYLEEIHTYDERKKRQGLGKQIFLNMLDLSLEWGIGRIRMFANDHSGEYFWSRRGGRLYDPGSLDDIPAPDGNGTIRKGFISKVRRNLNALSRDEAAWRQAHAILETRAADMNVRLAYLPGTIGALPVGAALLKDTQIGLVFDCGDEDQMGFARASCRKFDPPAALPEPATPAI